MKWAWMLGEVASHKGNDQGKSKGEHTRGGIHMKLVAIDFDGTLLSADGTISRENVQAIHEAQEQGHIIAICSGRSLHDTENILLNAGIECPVITGNGAIAYHSDAPIKKWIMPENVVTELLPLLEEEGYYYELYTNQGIYLMHKGKGQLEEEIRMVKEKDAEFPVEWAANEVEIQFRQYGLHYFNQYADIDIADLEIYKIFVLSFNKERLKALRDRLAGRQDLSLTSSGWTKLEIAHKEVSKGNALAYMANHLKIPMEDTVAIGDNLNDLSMFEVAGMGIAMGNAVDELKELSTHITRNYNEDGVAHALRTYVLDER